MLFSRPVLRSFLASPRGLGLAVFLGVFAVWPAAGQSLRRSANLWGEIPVVDPPPVWGGIEILAALFVLQLVVFGIAWLARLWLHRATDPWERAQWRQRLMQCSYLAAPLVTSSILFLAGAQRLAGVPIGLLALSCSTVTILLAAFEGWKASDRF